MTLTGAHRFRSAVLGGVLAGLIPAGAALAGGLSVDPAKETFPGRAPDTTYPRALAVSSGDHRAVLRATGSGIRKQLVFDVYEAVFYADETVPPGPDPAQQFAEADIARRMEMHFLHSVDGRRSRGAMESGFARVLGDAPRSPDLALAIERFMDAVGTDGVQEKDVMAITWLPGAGLFVTLNGKGPEAIDNAMLAGTVMSMWLGSRPVSDLLRQDLVRLVVGEKTPAREGAAPGPPGK